MTIPFAAGPVVGGTPRPAMGSVREDLRAALSRNLGSEVGKVKLPELLTFLREKQFIHPRWQSDAGYYHVPKGESGLGVTVDAFVDQEAHSVLALYVSRGGNRRQNLIGFGGEKLVYPGVSLVPDLGDIAVLKGIAPKDSHSVHQEVSFYRHFVGLPADAPPVNRGSYVSHHFRKVGGADTRRMKAFVPRSHGGDLIDWIDRKGQAGGFKPESLAGSHEAMVISSQIADHLAALHSKGIAHRDIKLDNCLDFGGWKLVDFGFWSYGEDRIMKGTPRYFCPFLFAKYLGGDKQCSLTDQMAGDVYAAGCLMRLLHRGKQGPVQLAVEKAVEGRSRPTVHTFEKAILRALESERSSDVLPANASPILREWVGLYQRMMDYQSSQRPDAATASQQLKGLLARASVELGLSPA